MARCRYSAYSPFGLGLVFTAFTTRLIGPGRGERCYIAVRFVVVQLWPNREPPDHEDDEAMAKKRGLRSKVPTLSTGLDLKQSKSLRRWRSTQTTQNEERGGQTRKIED